MRHPKKRSVKHLHPINLPCSETRQNIMFSINQRIVCVNADFSRLPAAYRKFYTGFPKQDRIYTVRDITQGIGGEVCCLLHQIHNPLNSKGVENGYNVDRFAPLETDTEEAEETTLASLSY